MSLVFVVSRLDSKIVLVFSSSFSSDFTIWFVNKNLPFLLSLSSPVNLNLLFESESTLSSQGLQGMPPSYPYYAAGSTATLWVWRWGSVWDLLRAGGPQSGLSWSGEVYVVFPRNQGESCIRNQGESVRLCFSNFLLHGFFAIPTFYFTASILSQRSYPWTDGSTDASGQTPHGYR